MSSSGNYTPATHINTDPNLFGLYLLIVALCLLPVHSSVVYAQTPARLTSARISFGLPNQQSTLDSLVAIGVSVNPNLQRLAHQVEAAWARVPQARALPDPTVMANVFLHPIETAAGAQRSNLTVAQRFPWLHTLSLQAKQSALQAAALESALQAEKFRLITQIRANYYLLYQLDREIEINKTDQEQLKTLGACPRIIRFTSLY